MEGKKFIQFLTINLNKTFNFKNIQRFFANYKLEPKFFMKLKKLYFNNQIFEKRSVFISLFAISALVFFSVKLFFNMYLNNPNFHMFIQSKGIFL